jgi:hypothetical protein
MRGSEKIFAVSCGPTAVASSVVSGSAIVALASGRPPERSLIALQMDFVLGCCDAQAVAAVGQSRRSEEVSGASAHPLRPDIIARLNAAVVDALADTAVRSLFADLGQEIFARPTDAGGARHVPKGRDREVVADHQGGRHQSGVNFGKSAVTGFGPTATRSIFQPSRRISSNAVIAPFRTTGHIM